MGDPDLNRNLTLLCFLAFVCFAGQTRSADDTAVDKKASQIQPVGSSGLRVELRETFESAIFAVLGLKSIEQLEKLPAEELQKRMTIRVQQPGLETNPTPLLGTYSVAGNELRFESRFPLSASVLYRVELSSQLQGHTIDVKPILFSSLPKKRIEAAAVTAVYPSADALPENVLKFYICFSAPMSRGEAYKRIHLMHEDQEVESPFLELGEELWDAEQKRFTLFVHPGRIKQGLKPREDIGAPMVDGNTYRLQIDTDWLGADLQPLAAPFAKKFRVVAADSKQPDRLSWNVVSPAAGSNQPVVLTFDEAMDHALLNRVVSVRDATGFAIPGVAKISQNETQWSFVPTGPWRRDKYSIRLESTLEDLAGNNLVRRFETLEQEANEDAKAPADVVIDWVAK